MKFFKTQTLVRLALLVAMEIVLSRFLSISAWNLKIGFSFLPIVAAGLWYGPLAAALVGGLGDFLGAILFPIGPYFPGFTLTNALVGVVFGLVLYRKRSKVRLLLGVLFIQLCLSLGLNSYFISVLYGSPLSALVVTRSVQCVVMGVVQFVSVSLLIHPLERLKKSESV